MLRLEQFQIQGAQRRISHIFRKGHLICLLGDRDSGRPQIFRALVGLDRLAGGRIVVDGRDVTDAHMARRGLVSLQAEPQFNPDQSVLDNIMVFRSQDRKIALAAADRLGLGAVLRRRPRALDIGECQRIALARAMARTPSNLVLEDPLDRLGLAEGLACLQEVREALCLSEQGTSILHFTADVRAALECSDEILIVEEGAILEAGTPEQLYYQPQYEFTARLLGEANFVGALGMDGNHLHTNYGLPILIPSALASIDVGGHYNIFFRPEAIRLETQPRRGALQIPVQTGTFGFGARGYRIELRAEYDQFVALDHRPPGDPQQALLSVDIADLHIMERAAGAQP